MSLQNSFLSALPYLGAWLFSMLSGVIADFLIERGVFSVTIVRKLLTVAGKEFFSPLFWFVFVEAKYTSDEGFNAVVTLFPLSSYVQQMTVISQQPP